MNHLIGLPGKSIQSPQVPERCPQCNGKEFFKQSDFRRSIGITLVTIASLLTFVLMYMGYNWFLVWSPMLVFLIFDRVLYHTRPVVVICYTCELKIRGVSADELDKVEGFDLETHDRIHYKNEEQTNKDKSS